MRWAVLAAAIVLVSCCWWVNVQAVDLAEIGIKVHVTHDPLLSEGSLRLVVSLGGYCKLAVAEGWAMRVDLGTPLGLFLPQLGIGSTHSIGERIALEAQLWIQSNLMDSVFLTLTAGARAILVRSETSRLTLASFPFALVGFFGWSGGGSYFPSASLNVYFDYSWMGSQNVVLGQTIGLTVVYLGPETEAALPLGELYGLRADSTTHAGFRR
jgi:hypothetical protein